MSDALSLSTVLFCWWSSLALAHWFWRIAGLRSTCPCVARPGPSGTTFWSGPYCLRVPGLWIGRVAFSLPVNRLAYCPGAHGDWVRFLLIGVI